MILQAARYIAENKRGTVAVIENEIGETGIDDKVLAAAGLVVRGIFAGCVCCQVTGDLINAVNEIYASIRPDWLVIEATGLAVPARIAEPVRRYCRCYDSLKTIVVVDAGRWEELSAVVGSLIASQVESGDAVVINKVDLADGSAALAAIIEEVRRLNEGAEIYLTSAAGNVPGGMLQEMISFGRGRGSEQEDVF